MTPLHHSNILARNSNPPGTNDIENANENSAPLNINRALARLSSSLKRNKFKKQQRLNVNPALKENIKQEDVLMSVYETSMETLIEEAKEMVKVLSYAMK